MIRRFLRVILIALAITTCSVSGAQNLDPAPVYEALFAQAESLGLGRTYYVREGEARSPVANEAEFPLPEELAAHTVENFGNFRVIIVDESYISGLWDSGCREGWEDFHRRYPDAGDLTQVSRVAFNGLGDQAAVYVNLGRGCQHASFATYYLEYQDGRWVITRRRGEGEA